MACRLHRIVRIDKKVLTANRRPLLTASGKSAAWKMALQHVVPTNRARTAIGDSGQPLSMRGLIESMSDTTEEKVNSQLLCPAECAQ
jgi:hypothetical protein